MHISRGNQYMVLSSLFFSLIGLCVKLTSHISNLEVNFFKSVIALAVSYSLLARDKVNIVGNNRRLLLARGIAGGLGIVLFFVTLQYLPLATATTIQNTSPIFTTILGIFIVKEPVSLRRWLFFAISFLGVALANGFDAQASPYYLCIGLMSALCMGLANNFTGKMGAKEHPLVIFCYSTLVTAIITGLYLFYDFTMPQPRDWLILLSMGLLSYAAHYLAIRAYQLAPVANVSAISYLGIPFALVLDFVLLGKHFPVMSLLGMGLVLLGVLLSLFYK